MTGNPEGDNTDRTGGFSPDTKVITADGPKLVAELSESDVLYTLDPSTKQLGRSPVTAVEPASFSGSLVNIQGKRCDLLVHPDQRLPFCTKSIDSVRFQRADDLHERFDYKFVNGWTAPSYPETEFIDITDFLDEYEIRTTSEVHGHTFRAALPEGCQPCRRNSHTGYYFDPQTFKGYQQELESVADELTIVGGASQRSRPYRFAAEDFVAFLGWFITEGSVTWRKNRDTAIVQIAQEKPEHRETIQSLLTRMGFDFQSTSDSFQFGSSLYGRFLTSLCGESSKERRLPSLVWSLPTEQKRAFFETLMAGDGNSDGTYYTVSERLARDLCQFGLFLGMKPRYIRRGDLWELYFSERNDGFTPKANVRTVQSEGEVYRLSVEGSSVVMAGRNGRFQWCGVSTTC
ncbi:hypothetical protein JCM30237_10740 [Halolamina litorea]|uniref:LAGLIDADG family homing endonuclease n=1 Tax=Halolamina litorea TaxID=1515593 RepID=A0ABD6BWY5_9EURY|nr:hypothetical protein [Halolamina litorea]